MKNPNKVLTKPDFEKFRQYIENRTGIFIDESKQNSFKISLDTRMNILDIEDYSNYYSVITNLSGSKEFDELLNLILIKETFFFRDEGQLRVLTNHLLPELIETKKDRGIKIWSAGCATGEEPYSIAISIMETFLPGTINVSIYATDISADALKKAKEGVYNKSSMRVIDKVMLNKYFTQRDRRYYLNDQVKQLVHFDTLNLTEPFFPIKKDSFDIIFCKNVIIYFRLETMKTIIHRFYDLLSSNSYLFVGYSESLWQISDEFELQENSGVFLYRKNERNKTVPSTKRFLQKEKAVHTIFSRQELPPSLKESSRLRISPAAQKPGVRTPSKDVDQKHKKDLSEWIKKGLQSNGDDDNNDEILKGIEDVLQENYKNIEAHLLAGKIYANMGLYDKALKKGMDALEINDLSAEAYLLTGSIYYKLGEKEKAISSFKKASYLDNTSVLSHYYLGNLYKDSNLIKQAIKEYKNVIHIFETNPESREYTVGEVFTVKQLKELCARNIEILQ